VRSPPLLRPISPRAPRRSAAPGGSGDLRYTLNKEGAANVLSLLFQSAYGGRAELGLIGDDEVLLKVSGDGSAWAEALRVKPDGAVGLGAATVPERLTVAGNIAPATDNAHSLGTGTRRFSAAYATTGTVSTSDLRAKRDVAPLVPELALALLGAAPPISFRWRQGEAGRHFGWAAQDWATALETLPGDTGLLVRLAPDDAEGELGLRPDQITAILHAAVLKLCDDLAAVKHRLAALEAAAT
jgi:hypothetical protein